MVFGLEARSTHVWRIGAPTPQEQGRHFLWRFWERVPPPANWAIFDRTWYGRVLVERIEGFCTKAEWQRAYHEINEFERTLTDAGVHFIKLLVHVSEEEQRKRMLKRLEKPHKRYKVGPEDFRNIAKRKQYLEAYKDMLDKTDTDYAPWHVIASDDKRHARLAGLKIIVDELSRGTKITPQSSIPRSHRPPSSCGAGSRRTSAKLPLRRIALGGVQSSTEFHSGVDRLDADGTRVSGPESTSPPTPEPREKHLFRRRGVKCRFHRDFGPKSDSSAQHVIIMCDTA